MGGVGSLRRRWEGSDCGGVGELEAERSREWYREFAEAWWDEM